LSTTKSYKTQGSTSCNSSPWNLPWLSSRCEPRRALLLQTRRVSCIARNCSPTWRRHHCGVWRRGACRDEARGEGRTCCSSEGRCGRGRERCGVDEQQKQGCET
jgi:hypothetical protein